MLEEIHPTLPALLSVGIHKKRLIMCLEERRSVQVEGPAAAEFVQEPVREK